MHDLAMTRAVLAAVLLAPAPALAARYDPDADRAALRQAATASRAAIVAATGLALEPEKASAIAAGIDEGLRQARLAAAAARSLDAAARQREAAMAADVKDAALDSKVKEAAAPVAAERLRWERASAEGADLRKKVEALPEDERKKLLPLVAKAERALDSAAGALRPLEEALKAAGERGLEMKAVRAKAAAPLVEVSSGAAGAIFRAEQLGAPAAEAKARLASLGEEPRAVSRSRAWEKLEPLRDAARLLFEAADRACNRADDFRRRSASFDAASEAFGKALSSAKAGPGAAKAALDEAQQELAKVRERLGKTGR